MANIIDKIRFVITAAAVSFSLAAAGASVQPQTYSLVGMDYVRGAYPELTGKGVKVCVVERSENYSDYMPLYDYKPDTDNPILNNADIVTTADIAKLNQAKSFHSTAVCSILSGSFSGDGDANYAAPLKDSTLYLYEFWEFMVDYLLTEPAKLQADVLTASLGTPLPQWWTMAMQYIVARDNIVAVGGVGNGGELFAECLYPAAGANFIAVGVADRRMLPLADGSVIDEFAQSSYGVTEFGIMKPDIVAPGNYLVADIHGGLSQSGSYSSYAAPAVAAVAGLLIERARDAGFTAAADDEGAGCVIRAVLLNSAAKGAGWHKGALDTKDDNISPLDAVQGCGVLDAAAALKLLDAGEVQAGAAAAAGWDNNIVSGTTENTYNVDVWQEAKYISAVLVWNRNFHTEFPFDYDESNNVDLRLELWMSEAANPDNERLVDYSDSINGNVEHIFCPANPAAKYRLVVVFSDRESADKLEMTQRYAVAFSSVSMPSQWRGHWLDLNADGDITIDDIRSMVIAAHAGRDTANAAMTQQRLETIKILLNEIAKKGRFE